MTELQLIAAIHSLLREALFGLGLLTGIVFFAWLLGDR